MTHEGDNVAETWLENVWVTSDPTRRGSEIHGLVDSALNDLHEVLLDGDAQHVWEEASESLTAEIVGLFDNDRSVQTRPDREQVREAVYLGYGPTGPPKGRRGQASLIIDRVMALLASSRPPAQADPDAQP